MRKMVNSILNEQDLSVLMQQFRSFLLSCDWNHPENVIQLVGGLSLLFVAFKVVSAVTSVVFFVFQPEPPKVVVDITEEESADVLADYDKFNPDSLKGETRTVHMWDPSTMDYLGNRPAMNEKEVKAIVARSREAQAQWKNSSFAQRRLLMRTMQRYITENQITCAKVAVRESGKTLLDALIGEVLVTCEKLTWLADCGEAFLQPEERASGRMMMMKNVRVEWVPLGVIGAIVPWNYPFHNVFNPVSAALFSGNSIVIKVSEYASWSIGYYKRIIDGCLDAVGAPRDLVQFVVGYGETGSALVQSGVDKIIFVGSPEIGAIVAKTAAANLTPVVLELGGKDPFVICEDADVENILQTACRGVWQNMGQNCAGPERFFVYDGIYDQFCNGVVDIVNKMKTGASLADPSVDCGAICMGPAQIKKYQALVDDAVSKGARCLAGGKIPTKRSALGQGSFYPPTILADVPENARIAQDEIFGPIMCIFRVKNNSDDEAVRMANNCDYALSSCAFSGNTARAKKLASRLHAGMSAVNDLEGCTYMSQSLPFGGYKKSGYDRFAGPEGLRGLCVIRSVCEDKIGFIRNSIPAPMHYPATTVGHLFAQGLINFFYSTSLIGNLRGIWALISYATPPKKPKQE